MEDPRRFQFGDIGEVDLVDVLILCIVQSVSVVLPLNILLGEQRIDVECALTNARAHSDLTKPMSNDLKGNWFPIAFLS